MNPLRALALVAFLPAAALAQQPEQAPPPPPPPADAPPAPETPAPAPEAAPAPASGPSVEDRITAVEGKLEGMEESSAATNATVDALKKIKVSGYIQGRYEWHDSAAAGFDATAAKNSRFLVRRGRLKTVYQGHFSEYMLQIDATPDGVTLKDAEASLVLDETVFPSPTPWELKLTLGQFKAPFGYEVIQSSGDREMPERTLMIRTFFPGERDRGVRLGFKYGVLRFAGAIINGNVFPALAAENKNPIVGSIDTSSYKDVLGRLGADLGFLVIGASGYFGHTIASTAASGMTPASYTRYSRVRVGGDAQAYVDVPAVGGLVLRAEVIYGVEKNLDYAGATADPCRDIKSLGWY
ncbi:MAG TPA: porin, partial [Polyangia bacterium]|nr:porin [Polyangia bacterium]